MSDPDPEPHEPSDAIRSAWAVRDALPTRMHAEILFDQIVDRLGSAAWIETTNEGRRRMLFRTDPDHPEWLVPWPVAALGLGESLSTVVWSDGPEFPPPRPGRAPRLRNLGPGELQVNDGPYHVTISYGADGRWTQTVVNDREGALTPFRTAVGGRTGQPVELLADCVAALDPRRHGPGRIHFPVPFPQGPHSMWNGGRWGLCGDLFHDRAPATSAWGVSDALVGEVVQWDADRAEAVARWRAEVERKRPWLARKEAPVKPPTDAEAAEQGMTVMRGATSHLPMPEPRPENTPAALTRIEALPTERPPRGLWKRLLDRYGRTTRHLYMIEPEGFLLIGGRLLDKLDLEALPSRLARADEEHDRMPSAMPPWPSHLPPLICNTRLYAPVEEPGGCPGNLWVEGASGHTEFLPDRLDGGEFEARVLRFQWGAEYRPAVE